MQYLCYISCGSFSASACVPEGPVSLCLPGVHAGQPFSRSPAAAAAAEPQPPGLSGLTALVRNCWLQSVHYVCCAGPDGGDDEGQVGYV